MKSTKRLALSALVACGLLAACGSDDETDSTTAATEAPASEATEAPAAEGTEAPATEETEAPATEATEAPATEETTGGEAMEGLVDGAIPCEGQYEGETVTLFSSIRDIEADRLDKSLAAFEECTGADLQHEGSGEFEAQLKVRIDGGNAPDIAIIPQPGLMTTLANEGALVDLGQEQADWVGEHFISGWKELGEVDGTFYGSPFGANVKSLVWYNPQMFAEKGYEIPQTWDELLALSDQIVADGGTPWCVGAESGGATGWVITDWFEDLMLRINGPEVYDQWVAHEIPFNDPQVLAVAEAAGSILKNPDYIYGGVESIATTAFQESGLGILDGSCYLHRQASFYGNNFPEGTELGPEGVADAFYFPVAKEGDPKVMLGGGELLSATNDRPVVMDAIRFMSSADYANARAAEGNWISANKDYDLNNIPNELDKQFADLLVSSDVFRFDGSDMMPGAVGAGTFWTEAVAWIIGGDTETMLDNIEASWPAS